MSGEVVLTSGACWNQLFATGKVRGVSGFSDSALHGVLTPRAIGLPFLPAKLGHLNILFQVCKERGFASLVVCSSASHLFQMEKDRKLFSKAF